MLVRAFLWIIGNSPRGRRIFFRAMFGTLIRICRPADWWTFMNYGFVSLDPLAKPVPLHERDEPERYCAQLYHHVAAGADLHGKDVLEVSCGRGGGASYVRRYLQPRSMVGVDISSRQIDFCRRVHRVPDLTFKQGDAERLPFADESFDAVINIEASFCYGDIRRFFAEVDRVLRPGGHFLYADLRLDHEIGELLAALDSSGLELTRREDITRNVVEALKIDNQRRERWVDMLSPKPFRDMIGIFAGAEGTRIPEMLGSDSMKYLCFVLSKPAAEAVAETRRAVNE